eukprot:6162922-Prymnesium_polylepis.1
MERSRPFGAIHCSALLPRTLGCGYKSRRVIWWTDGSETWCTPSAVPPHGVRARGSRLPFRLRQT